MSMSDPIADLLTRIRNGLKARKEVITCPASASLKAILDVLIAEGFLVSCETKEVRKSIRQFEVRLKYYDGDPAIKKIDRVSRPGRRVYKGFSELPKVSNGLGIAIISTSKGVMTDAQARLQNLGGEVICSTY